MIWQRRFWEHIIRDDQDLIQHVEYIHYNLCKTRIGKIAGGLGIFEFSPVCARRRV